MPRLIDGREVDSASAAWRSECLARHVLALPTLVERREWLAAFEKRHGLSAADALRDGMKALHEAGKVAL